MAYGLIIRNEDTGAVILSTDDSITRVLGIFNTGTSNGSRSYPALALGRGFANVLQDFSYPTFQPPTVTVSGTTVSWSFNVPDGKVSKAADVIVGLY